MCVFEEDSEARRAACLFVDRLEFLNAALPEPVAAPRRASRLLLATAALVLIGASLYLNRDTPPAPDAPRTIETVSLVVSHSTPPPARAARVVLDSQPIVSWSLEGETR